MSIEPKNLAVSLPAMASRHDVMRPKNGSYASWLECGHLRSLYAYANFIQDHHAYAFDYKGHLQDHWTHFTNYIEHSWKDKLSFSEIFLSSDFVANLFILFTASTQLLGSYLLSLPIQWIAQYKHGPEWRTVVNLTALEKFEAALEMEYFKFTLTEPSCRFDYVGKIKGLWQTIWSANESRATKCRSVFRGAMATLGLLGKAAISAPIRALYTPKRDTIVVHIEGGIQSFVEKISAEQTEQLIWGICRRDGEYQLVRIFRDRLKWFCERSASCQPVASMPGIKLVQVGGREHVTVDVEETIDGNISIASRSGTPLKTNRVPLYTVPLRGGPENKVIATYKVQVNELQAFLGKLSDANDPVLMIH